MIDQQDRPPSAEQEDKKQDKPGQNKDQSVAEWVTFSFCLLILLGLVGSVTYLSFTKSDEPPQIVIKPQLEKVRQSAGAYYLPIEVSNKGDQTAEEVRVRVLLSNGQGEPEVGELTIQFLAGAAEEEGVVVFRQDPSKGTLTTDVVSYLKT